MRRSDWLDGLRDSPDPWGGPPGWIDPGGPEVPGPECPYTPAPEEDE